ncbi:MAG: succinate dehydrogenase cytochrome b subunit [Spirochaetaceae bacterium]|nr:succinate dehydrogenase cytochrome b subunit [Spirochaetaceae bacterium]
MRWLLDLLSTSIGKKVLMALTGLFLVLFLAVHLYGNLYLYAGEEAFNHHAESISGNALIRIVEVVLFLSIIAHAVSGVQLTIRNRRARPQRYRVKRRAGFSTLASRSMIVSGSVVFIFIVIHLRNFFYEARFGRAAAGESLYRVVSETFALPGYAALYVIAMVLLGVHLAHGFLSALRTLGIEHQRYTPVLRGVGLLLAVGFAAAFASMPIVFFVRSLA